MQDNGSVPLNKNEAVFKPLYFAIFEVLLFAKDVEICLDNKFTP